jgi:polyhydroxybutyrate depolymerase
MMRLRMTVIVMAAISVAPAAAWAACDGTPVTAGSRTIAVDALMRTFVIRVPSSSDGRTPAPVVFALHPFGTNAQYMASRAPIALTWREAVVIYPNGTPRAGTGPGFAWQGRSGELEDRDLRFFDAMMTWLATNACIDEKRVFVLGYSNGAGLAYLLACERADRLAGVAIVSGRMGCSPNRAKPIIMTHGVADATIGYDQAVEATRVWAAKNSCQGPPPPARSPGCVMATGCASSLTMCTHAGGHEYDSSFTGAAVEFFKSIGANSAR